MELSFSMKKEINGLGGASFGLLQSLPQDVLLISSFFDFYENGSADGYKVPSRSLHELAKLTQLALRCKRLAAVRPISRFPTLQIVRSVLYTSSAHHPHNWYADLVSTTAALPSTDAHKPQTASWLDIPDIHTAAVVFLYPSMHTACASASSG